MKILVSGQKEFFEFLKSLAHKRISAEKKVERQTKMILQGVKERGDQALLKFTRLFDQWPATKENILVSPREIREALKSLRREEVQTLEMAAERIAKFHYLQKKETWLFAEDNGNILGELIRPLERVGIYVPGGKAAYPSSVLMNAVPAQIAGVPQIIMVTPAYKGEIKPAVLAAAAIAGVKKIFKIGGAQAIGALAYGTKLVPQVDKIVGPGNIYVATAKRLVAAEVAIDSVAGPSEILIIADSHGDPSFIAADLLSQAEHDPQARAFLICFSRRLAEKVRQEIDRQLAILPRRDIAIQSLEKGGAILVVKSVAEAVKICNAIAPEHLELAVASPFRLVNLIKHAGAIFLGQSSPEAIGDYLAGPNHVLPTGGTARFSSPLGVYDFQKRSNLICLSPTGLQNLSAQAKILAKMEGLDGHGEAVSLRIKKWKEGAR